MEIHIHTLARTCPVTSSNCYYVAQYDRAAKLLYLLSWGSNYTVDWNVFQMVLLVILE